MAGSFVDPKTALDSVKSSSWKFFNFRVAGGEMDRSYVLCKLCFNSGNRKIGQVKYCGALLREAIIKKKSQNCGPFPYPL